MKTFDKSSFSSIGFGCEALGGTDWGPVDLKKIEEAIHETLDGLPRGKRRDPDSVETAVERAVRGTVAERWGKKPVCHVLVVNV